MSVQVYKKELRTAQTQQNERERADINRIVNRYMSDGQGGNPLERIRRQPVFGNFYEVPDFGKALITVQRGREMWNRMPAKLRLRFENDPQKLMEFVLDENNYDEAAELGLIGADALAERLEKKKTGKKEDVKPSDTDPEIQKLRIKRDLLQQIGILSNKIKELDEKS